MSVYDINYSSVVKQQTPVRLRKTKRLAWLRVLVAGVISVYNLFRELRYNARYYLAHNGQVCYLEAALNDTFDYTGRNIYITDPEYIDPVYIYMVPEDREVPLVLDSELPGTFDYDAPVWLFTFDETSIFGTQFVVHYPLGMTTFNEARMKALIGKYRLPSKRKYLLTTAL